MGILYFLLFCVYTLFVSDLTEAYEFPETRVLDDVFYEYYKEARPATEQKPVVKASHQLSLNRVISMKDNLLMIDTWQVTSWNDPRLVWDKSDYDVESLNLDPSKVWKPDIVNFNNAGGNSGLIYNDLPLVVYHTGQVVYIPPTRLTTQCKPHGEVFYCIWTFGSWTHDIKKLDLNNTEGKLDMSEYEESPKIAILHSSVHRRLKKYACCPDRYAVVTYNLTIKWKDTDRFSGLEPLQKPDVSDNATKSLLQNGTHVKRTIGPVENVTAEANLINDTNLSESEFKEKNGTNGNDETVHEPERTPPESTEENKKEPIKPWIENENDEVLTSSKDAVHKQRDKNIGHTDDADHAKKRKETQNLL